MPKVLVTGAYGMLGQDLCPILQDEGYEVVETDIENLDITNFEVVNRVLHEEQPDIIIHCAAYTDVDKAEEDLEMVRLINVKGTEYLTKVCADINAVFVYISTDYVFDGQSKEPYKPTDKTAPLNNYGLTKLEGEEIVRNTLEKYYICRTSWLYGHYGKNFVETMINLANKPELKVVDDQYGCPTWTVELANAIIKILEKKPFGTYHTCCSNFTSWYGFAKEIFLQQCLKNNLKPCTTDEYPRLAKRPAYSVMDNEGLCRDWRVALKDYLNLRQESIDEV